MRLEHFRGAVWPQKPVIGPSGKPLYRYMVAGLLISEEPLTELDSDTKGEFLLDGQTFGAVGDQFRCMPRRKTLYPLGDATSILTSLKDCLDDED